MDAVAVSISAGIARGRATWAESLRMAAAFGAFQDFFGWRGLLLLGLATSVDALAVGLTLSLLEMPVATAIAVIGGVTFALCLPAVHMGARLGARFAHRAELAGGLVLVAVGAKILAEHLSGAA